MSCELSVISMEETATRGAAVPIDLLEGLGPRKKESPELAAAFSQIRHEFPMHFQIGFVIIVEGLPRSLRPSIRDEVYLIGHEALSNAFHHSHATNIELEIEYAADHLRVLIRDNGRGIDSRVLSSGREGKWGMSTMKELAEGMGAKLRVLSRNEAGTEVEIVLPGQIAFEFAPENRPGKWLSRLFS